MTQGLWVLASGMLVGFQGGAGFFRKGRLTHPLLSLGLWAAVIALVALFWQNMSDESLRGWWFGAGAILVVRAVADIHQQQKISHTLSNEWVEPLEAVGTLLALMIGSGQIVAVAAGFMAGFALPFALQNWMSPWQGAVNVFRTVTLGAVGLENLTEAIAPLRAHTDLKVLWMIPWLLWWEISDWLWRDSSIAWPPKQ